MLLYSVIQSDICKIYVVNYLYDIVVRAFYGLTTFRSCLMYLTRVRSYDPHWNCKQGIAGGKLAVLGELRYVWVVPHVW